MAQKKRAREAHKSVDVLVNDSKEAGQGTEFIGYDQTNLRDCEVSLLDTITQEGETYLIFDRTPFYAEMGGKGGTKAPPLTTTVNYTDVIKDSNGHFFTNKKTEYPDPFSGKAIVSVNQSGEDTQRHHTATHILHWALREVLRACATGRFAC